MSVAEVAGQLGKSVSTVTRWCESGKLPAITKPYGKKTSWLINPQALELLNAIHTEKSNSQPTRNNQPRLDTARSHATYYESWVLAMQNGFLTGRPFSKRTIDDYKFYVKAFIEKDVVLSVETLKAELLAIPIAQVAKRQHCYKALVCFGKFLIREEALHETFIEKARPLYPKRVCPPKRPTINEVELNRLLAACTEELERFIVMLLGQTGIRASEACQLQWQDIDLEKHCLTIRNGKGGKSRVIGLTAMAKEGIQHFKEEMGCFRQDDYLLLDKLGNQMNRNGLFQRLERIGIKAGVKVSPHALRRSFVTLNANKGRPLQMLQKACGHSDIKTTMSYCQTTEQEIIEAMQTWD